MNKNKSIIFKTYTPEMLQKNIKPFFIIILIFSLISGAWPLAIIIIFMQKPITKIIEKVINKHAIKFIKNTSTENSKIPKNITYAKKNTVEIDQGRNIASIIAFIVFILVSLGFYYIPKFINNLENQELINYFK